MLRIRITKNKGIGDRGYPVPYPLSPDKGFTLVELLVATSIMGMIALAVLSAFGTGFYAFGRVESFAGAQADILLALDRWERDVRNSFPSAAVEFKGDSQSISFPSLITVFDEEDQGEAVSLGQVSYSFDEQEKTFTIAPTDYVSSPSAGGQEPPAEVLAHVEDLHFSYYFYKKEIKGEEEKVEHGWQGSWTQQDEGIPRGVKIELTFLKEGQEVPLARTVFIPAGGSVVVKEESGAPENGEGGDV